MGDLENRARFFATVAHERVGQKRKYTGEPYVNHPEAVAALVRSVPHTEAMLAAAWLHDTVEDTGVTLDEIRSLFGEEVAGLVGWLTDVSRPEDGNREARKAKDRAHTSLAPPEAKTIKLADLIDNSESILKRDPKFAAVYLHEKALLLEVLREGDPTLWARADAIVRQWTRPAAENLGGAVRCEAGKHYVFMHDRYACTFCRLEGVEARLGGAQAKLDGVEATLRVWAENQRDIEAALGITDRPDGMTLADARAIRARLDEVDRLRAELAASKELLASATRFVFTGANGGVQVTNIQPYRRPDWRVTDSVEVGGRDQDDAAERFGDRDEAVARAQRMADAETDQNSAAPPSVAAEPKGQSPSICGCRRGCGAFAHRVNGALCCLFCDRPIGYSVDGDVGGP